MGSSKDLLPGGWPALPGRDSHPLDYATLPGRTRIEVDGVAVGTYESRMIIERKTVQLESDERMGIYDITPQIRHALASTRLQNGQVLVFSRHTTTALAINEYEQRLLEDIKTLFRRLVPPDRPYAHNDLLLRGAPPDEPMNAPSHLTSLLLHTSETIPVLNGRLDLGTWQSVLFFELDGPRVRTVSLQFSGTPD